MLEVPGAVLELAQQAIQADLSGGSKSPYIPYDTWGFSKLYITRNGSHSGWYLEHTSGGWRLKYDALLDDTRNKEAS